MARKILSPNKPPLRKKAATSFFRCSFVAVVIVDVRGSFCFEDEDAGFVLVVLILSRTIAKMPVTAKAAAMIPVMVIVLFSFQPSCVCISFPREEDGVIA